MAFRKIPFTSRGSSKSSPLLMSGNLSKDNDETEQHYEGESA
jgi:hypothetical protein